MPENVVKLRDAFGVGREVPLNYVSREGVDEKFVDNLTRAKHVVVFGSSKQGKTTLRRHCLSESDYTVVSCLNSMGLSDLHGAILKAIGYRIEQTQTKTTGGAWKYGAQFAGEGKVPFVAKASAEGSVNRETNNTIAIATHALELDLNDVNDIVTALREAKFKKLIILEDFHYLPVETQRTFAFALKAFHENSEFCFIIVGVWRDKNRLIYYNGDLTNRVVSIDADAWSRSQLREVIEAGEQLMNVSFSEATVDALLRNSFDGVALVQEGCYRLCEIEGVYETQNEPRHIHNTAVDTIIREIVNDHAGRYLAFITNFSEGFQESGLQMISGLSMPY
jgi:hypothetical protein